LRQRTGRAALKQRNFKGGASMKKLAVVLSFVFGLGILNSFVELAVPVALAQEEPPPKPKKPKPENPEAR
jgi:hypothetical protein